MYYLFTEGLRHLRVMCDWCRIEGLSGMIWKCVRCFDYYLCSQCYMSGRHSLEHEFERINSKQLTKRYTLLSQIEQFTCIPAACELCMCSCESPICYFWKVGEGARVVKKG